MKLNLVAACLFASVAAIATGARAELAYPTYASEVTDSFYDGVNNPPRTHAIATAGTVQGLSSGYASIFNTPNPTLTVQSAISDPDVDGEIYQSSLSYFFSINGPNIVEYIPVDLAYGATSNNSASSLDNSFESLSEVSVSIGGYNTQGGGTVLLNESIPASQLRTSGIVTTNVYANTSTEITLGARAQIFNDTGGSAYITLDPILYIDSSFSLIDPNYLSDYSISLSPGIGNSPDAVPEPSTWLLSILGLGGVGVALRQGRRSAPA